MVFLRVSTELFFLLPVPSLVVWAVTCKGCYLLCAWQKGKIFVYFSKAANNNTDISCGGLFFQDTCVCHIQYADPGIKFGGY